MVARDRLNAELRRNPPHAAAALAERLGVSAPTLLRMVRERPDDIFRLGSTKNARYALRRPLRGKAAPNPVFRIDTEGRGHEVGTLELAAPSGTVLDLRAWSWPSPDDNPHGWWDGLPYPLYDMQPQGFIGRNFARAAHGPLGIAPDPKAWSDDDIVWILSQSGADTPGNLIVGEVAYQKWLTSVATGEAAIAPEALAETYARQATAAVSGGIAGSSAAGEFPKFTARRELAGALTPHVIVKFSGADNSAAVQRWSDLLVCEQLALDALAEFTGLATARSRIIRGAGRAFLESERFDRIGQFGRRSLITLASLHAALLGTTPTTWPDIAAKMAAKRWLTAAEVERVGTLWWYGKLIANSDMHLGNLSFHIRDATAGEPSLELTPAYDMLPMRYAPLSGGEVPTNNDFSPPLPLPRERERWLIAHKAALNFWQRAGDDQRISVPFRDICQANHITLAPLAIRV